MKDTFSRQIRFDVCHEISMLLKSVIMQNSLERSGLNVVCLTFLLSFLGTGDKTMYNIQSLMSRLLLLNPSY